MNQLLLSLFPRSGITKEQAQALFMGWTRGLPIEFHSADHGFDSELLRPDNEVYPGLVAWLGEQMEALDYEPPAVEGNPAVERSASGDEPAGLQCIVLNLDSRLALTAHISDDAQAVGKLRWVQCMMRFIPGLYSFDLVRGMRRDGTMVDSGQLTSELWDDGNFINVTVMEVGVGWLHGEYGPLSDAPLSHLNFSCCQRRLLSNARASEQPVEVMSRAASSLNPPNIPGFYVPDFWLSF